MYIYRHAYRMVQATYNTVYITIVQIYQLQKFFLKSIVPYLLGWTAHLE